MLKKCAEKYIWLILLSLFLVLLLAEGLFLQRSYDKDFVSFCVPVDGNEVEIRVWRRTDGTVYAFLPSCADMNNIMVNIEGNGDVSIDGVSVTNRMTMERFKTDTPYALRCDYLLQSVEYRLVFLKSENVPALFVNCVGGSVSDLYADKNSKKTVSVLLSDVKGNAAYLGQQKDEIGGHGNSTWGCSKKSWNLSLDEPADLLGMGAAQKWVLLANATDRSNLRNKLVYDFANQLDYGWTPEGEFVDLYLDGSYAGLYLLCEKVEMSENRLSPENSPLFETELETRLEDGDKWFKTDSGVLLTVKYPKPCTEQEKTDFRTEIQNMENKLLDCCAEWPELLDMDSWAKRYLIDEVFESQDAGALSQFLYIDGNNRKICAGPIWDYDLCMGNGDDSATNPQAFVARREWKYNGYHTPWYGAMYNNPEFFAKLTELYEAEFLPYLQNELPAKADEIAGFIHTAARNDALRWNIPEEEIEKGTESIKTFARQRMNFLNSVWLDDVQYCTVTVQRHTNWEYLNYTVPYGETFDELPDAELMGLVEIEGWYYANSDKAFDPNAPVTEDTVLYAKGDIINKADDDNQNFSVSGIIRNLIADKQMAITIATIGAFAVFGIALIWIDGKRRSRGGEK